MLKDKIKEVLGDDKKSNKRKIENLVIFIIVLIVTVIILNMILNDETSSNEEKNETKNNKQLAFLSNNENEEADENTETYDELEQRLANILESISGVGKVKVLINYSSTNKVVAMYNENTKQSSTEETDTSGGVRTITETDTQKDIAYSEENGDKKPVTETIIMPTIEGAIVTAKGANNASVKTNIVNAVVAVTGLSMDKVQVFEMGE